MEIFPHQIIHQYLQLGNNENPSSHICLFAAFYHNGANDLLHQQ
jgi:hypothetical protein